MIVLNYFDDESVQSWILRNLKVSGSLNFFSVIGLNGYLLRTPHFTANVDVNLAKFNDLELLNWLRKSHLAVKKAGIFDNPIDYIDSVYNVLGKRGLDRATKGSIPIRFCKDCIKAQVKKLGFAYFKSEWLDNVLCSIHGRTLDQIKESTYKESLNSLRLIMSGRVDEFEFIESPTPLPSLKSTSDVSNYHVMPCLIFDFYRWASMERDDGYLDDSHWDYYHANLMRKKISDDKIHFYFSVVYPRRFPKQFGEFMAERTEMKEYRFGINQPLSLKENLLKSNRHNCSKCMIAQHHCPITLIARINIHSPLDRVCWINMCDDYLRFWV